MKSIAYGLVLLAMGAALVYGAYVWAVMLFTNN